MKILIVSQYFWPESFRINDLALELNNRGHNIVVLTGKPNYPDGKYYKGYSFCKNNRENYFGVDIRRVPIIPRNTGSGFWLIMNYLSFVLFSCLYIIFHREKFDITFTFAVSPITQVYPALLHKFLYKSKTFLWVQDLWPESVSAAGNIKNKIIHNLLNKLVVSIYRSSDQILVSSTGFINSINTKLGSDKKQITYFPNWAEDIFLDVINDDITIPRLPEGFKIMFAGNIGEAQDFESIVQAILLTNTLPINWIFIGEGRKLSWFKNEIELNNIKNVYFLGRLHIDLMPRLYNFADVMLVTLKRKSIYALTVPSKIQSYLASGKIIIGMLDGEGNKIINESKGGYCVNSGNYRGLASLIANLLKIGYNEKQLMQESSKKYYNEHFLKNILLNKLEILFSENATNSIKI